MLPKIRPLFAPGTPVRLKSHYYSGDYTRSAAGDVGFYVGLAACDKYETNPNRRFHEVFILGVGPVDSVYPNEIEVVK